MHGSMAEATAELIWFESLLSDLRILLPVVPDLWCNSMTVILAARNPVSHARTKHTYRIGSALCT